MNSGESLSFMELDIDAVPELRDPAVLDAASAVVGICPRVHRSVIEEAKKGYTKELSRVMGSAPLGMLLKLSKPVCGEIGTCPMAKPGSCTTKNSKPRGRPFIGLFPICWELDVDMRFGLRAATRAREISAIVVASWREDRRVLIISS